MFEVEVKAYANDDIAITERLMALKPTEIHALTYYDTYYDTPQGTFRKDHRVLRIRTISGESLVRHFLTAKTQPFDIQSMSKQEFETEVARREEVESILSVIGFRKSYEITKTCRLFVLKYDGRKINASLIALEGSEQRFVELETMIRAEHESQAALKVLWALLKELGVKKGEIMTMYYSDFLDEQKNRGERGET